MLQRSPIARAQVKAGNTSDNLLCEIRKIVYSLYRAKEITKKVIIIQLNQCKYYHIHKILQNGYYIYEFRK